MKQNNFSLYSIMADFAAQKAAFNAQFGPAKPSNIRPTRKTSKNSNFNTNFSRPSSLNPRYNGSSPTPANWSARTRNQRFNSVEPYTAHTNIAAKAAKCQAEMKLCMARPSSGGSRTRRRKTRARKYRKRSTR